MNVEIETKQKRLQALRARHQARSDAQLSPAHPIQAAQEPGRNVLLQRIVQFLGKPRPGERLIEGGRTSEERVQQMVTFLRTRSQDHHPLAKRFRWFLEQLEQVAPGEERVAGVSARQLRRLLNMARDDNGLLVEEAGDSLSAPSREPWEEALPKLDAEIDALAEVLANMAKSLTQLTTQIDAAQQQLKALEEWRLALDPQSSLSLERTDLIQPRRDEEKVERELSEWFSDFLD
ncbi:MAG: hypothetical protein KDI73_13880 [Candidatus Competibacteraceae bacterium]|nr:hypothetical protein [Candidatus Competibacteraceae bacterium]